MKFSDLAQLYQHIENESSYTKIREYLATFFKRAPKKEIGTLAYFTIGTIDSSFSPTVLGMATKMILESIAQASQTKETTITHTYKQLGDVGLAAEKYIQGKGTSVQHVYAILHRIATTTGPGSSEKKIQLLAKLLQTCTPIEAKYVSRIALGQLRLGASDKTVLDALAIAFTGSKQARSVLEQAYHACPDIGRLAKTLANHGISAIKKIDATIGIPIESMLCQRIKTLFELNKKMSFPVAVEEKYDGERMQIHKKENNITIYSRRLDDITHQFPDAVLALKKAIKAKNCIIDSECMPIDSKGNYLPFQIIMQRKRNHDIHEYVTKVPVVLFLFDLLYLEKSLLHETFNSRYSHLQKIVKESKRVKLATHQRCSNIDCIENFFNDIVARGGEGIVIKSLDGKYQAGVRAWNWIKWKPEYATGLRDTFDLVVVGAYAGRGRRSGSYGSLLCAIYNPKKDIFETFCKLGSGFSDDDLRKLPKILSKRDEKPSRVHVQKEIHPDFWIEPLRVVEVTGAQITKSPTHTCGYALRFPRFIRWRDKKPEQATTNAEIEQT